MIPVQINRGSFKLEEATIEPYVRLVGADAARSRLQFFARRKENELETIINEHGGTHEAIESLAKSLQTLGVRVEGLEEPEAVTEDLGPAEYSLKDNAAHLEHPRAEFKTVGAAENSGAAGGNFSAPEVKK